MDALAIISFVVVNILLPAALIVVLIFLAIVFKNSGQAIKRFDSIADDIEYKLKLLNAPLEAIINFQETFKNFGAFISSVKKTIVDIPKHFGKKGDSEDE